MTSGGVSSDTPAIATQVAVLPKHSLIVTYNLLQEALVFWLTKDWSKQGLVDVGNVGDLAVSPDQSTILLAGLASEDDAPEGAPDKKARLIFVNPGDRKIDHQVETSGNSPRCVFDRRRTDCDAQDGQVRVRSSDGRHERRSPIKVPDGHLLGTRMAAAQPRDRS